MQLKSFIAVGVLFFVFLILNCINCDSDSSECDPEESDCSGADGDTGNDVIVPVEGEPCSEQDTLVCGFNAMKTKDNVALYCDMEIYKKVFECPGSQECWNVVGHVSICCGTENNCLHYAGTESPCSSEESVACNFDSTAVLMCLNGYWFEAVHCPPSKCTMHTEGNGESYLACENMGYSEGDWCDFADEGVVCSTDFSKILRCSDGTTVVDIDCSAEGKKCARLTENGRTVIGCD
ncbi:MAG: hypothetical protein GY847_41415 [Proteobacteria bacterium]|nr:hypothetical protein [Pseudomonadota bacterium]